MKTVSIITPTLGNRPQMLQETIDSVKAQTIPVLEHIIVTDTGQGQVKTINEGISKSKGECFVFLSDDDKLDPQFIEKTLAEMDKSGSYIVGTFLENFGDQNGIHGPRDFPFGTSLCLTSLWYETGGFDEKSGPACDADFWLTCIRNGAKWSVVPEPLFKSRVHDKQYSRIADWGGPRIHMKQKHGNNYV